MVPEGVPAAGELGAFRPPPLHPNGECFTGGGNVEGFGSVGVFARVNLARIMRIWLEQRGISESQRWLSGRAVNATNNTHAYAGDWPKQPSLVLENVPYWLVASPTDWMGSCPLD